jgi:L-lactate dehydrogenase complex protein LldE
MLGYTDKPITVQLFATCLIETLRPESGMAVVRVLESLGIGIEYPEGQTCCGQPAFNAGAWEDARAMARYTLDLLARSPAPVVVPSGSCAAMIVRHYPELLAEDPRYGPLAESIAGRTFEFSQFLVDVLGAADFSSRGEETITYHSSCQLQRSLGVINPPRRLLAGACGSRLRELPGDGECCGFGGLFSLKMSDISGAMLRRKLDNIEKSGASTVVGCDVSCLLHIAGGLQRRGSPIKTRHIAEILAGDS